MMSAAQGTTIGLTRAERERAVWIICSAVVLCLGGLAALGSAQWLVATIVLAVIFFAAMTMPSTWLAVVLAALMPFQLYFEIPGTALTLRVAVLFAFAAALRLLVLRVVRKDLTRWPVWVLPATVFLVASLIGALGAASRYLAFKGIYDWLTIFAVVFVASETVRGRQQVVRLVYLLIAEGVVQAALGLLQYASGLDAILSILRMPISTLFFQPNLLQDRLADLSFNWVVFDRASPFGTFINGIDYAIFLATLIGLALPLLFVERKRLLVLFGCMLLMGGALLLTFKGSGLVAFGSGAVIAVLLSLRRPSPRLFAVGLIGLGCVVLLALPFADLIVQRALFLVQREQGGTGTAGRLEIWAGLLQVFLQRPIFGFGLNHAAALTEASRTLNRGAIAFNFPSAESAYVSALVETGIVGLAALLTLFVDTFMRAVRRAWSEPLFAGVAAALVALLAGNLTVAGFTTDQNGMLLGLLIGAVYASIPETV